MDCSDDNVKPPPKSVGTVANNPYGFCADFNSKMAVGILTIAISDREICDFCLGPNQQSICKGEYVSNEDFDQLQKLISTNQENFTAEIKDVIKIYNDGLVNTIGDMLKEGNQKVIKNLLKKQLKNTDWFQTLDEKMQDIYTDHAFLKMNQKDILTKLKDVSKQIAMYHGQSDNSWKGW